jgi:flagellar motor switch protein FliM
VAEILSQQEIDNLLSGIETNPIEEPPPSLQQTPSGKEAVLFDFRLPHRLSKNQLRTFQAVHESFAEAFSSYLVSRLQTTVAINVTSVDQLFYSEYVLSIASPSCLYVFRIVESDALAILEISPQLMLSTIEHLLGGSTEGEKKARLITKIEQSIAKGIILRALSDLQRSWKTIADMSFKLERYESEGDFVQIAPASEIVLIVSFEVSIGDQKYLMNLCFPTFALDDVLAKLSAQYFSGLGGIRSGGEWSSSILKKLETTTIPLKAVLGTTSITITDLLELHAGDVLNTNIPSNGEVQIEVGGKPRLFGKPGISNGKFAIQVTTMTNETNNE